MDFRLRVSWNHVAVFASNIRINDRLWLGASSFRLPGASLMPELHFQLCTLFWTIPRHSATDHFTLAA